MDRIFYGLCFVLLQVNMNGLDLLPDCVGYFLMYRGLGQLALKDSDSQRAPALFDVWNFKNHNILTTRSWCGAMFIFTLSLPFVDLLGDAVFVIGSVFALMKLRILFALVMIMKKLAAQLDTDLGTDTLKQRFFLVAAADVAVYAVMLLQMNGLISGLVGLGSMIISVLFLMAFHRTRLAVRAAQI